MILVIGLNRAGTRLRLALQTGASSSRGVMSRPGWLHHHPSLSLHALKVYVPIFVDVRVNIYGRVASLALELLVVARVEHND